MSTVAQLEQQREIAKELIERSDAALRLAENRDFRRLFLNEYFVTEAARLVQMSGDPTLTKQQQDDALEMAKATGHAKRYLSIIVQQAIVSEREMDELEENLVAARAEEDAEAASILAERNEGSID